MPGSGTAFEAADLEPLLPGLVRLARSLTRDRHAADDLVQETVARALARRSQFRGESSLATWLHRILHNLAIDRARRSEREVLVDDVERRWADDAFTVDPAVVVERAERRDDLEDALMHLPAIYRAAVVLHDVEGLTTAQVAALAEIELPAAKQRLRRGRMMLVNELARADERRAALAAVPMRCWEARSHLSDYLDGELDRSTAAAVEGHLARCPTCPPIVAALVGVQAALGATRDPDSVVDPALLQRLRSGR